MIRDLFSEYPELYEEFRSFCDFSDVDLPPEIVKEPQSSPAPIESRGDLDLKLCKKYGPSYRGLPPEYVQPICSGRNELCHEVLNDHWISVPTGSEDFKASIKNQYEEALFACEDQRHELDMYIEINYSTIQALVLLAKDIAEGTDEDLLNFRIEDGLDILHLRSIDRIYGNRGNSIFQGLCENPIITIPVVLRRLQQKDQEWQNTRSASNNIWQEIYDKNYYRALDYQCTQFKLKDKKLLNPRELLSEIKNDYFDTPSSPDTTVISHPTMLHFEMKEFSIFADIEELIDVQAQRIYTSTSDPEKLSDFRKFVQNFFVTPSFTKSPSASFGLFFGNNSFYVFFRFYHTLYERLLEAKRLAKESLKNPTPINNTKIVMCTKLIVKQKKTFKSIDEKYSFFLHNMLKPLIEGDIDANKYEDLCREIFGISSYVLFTMEKLIQVLVKQVSFLFILPHYNYVLFYLLFFSLKRFFLFFLKKLLLNC